MLGVTVFHQYHPGEWKFSLSLYSTESGDKRVPVFTLGQFTGYSNAGQHGISFANYNIKVRGYLRTLIVLQKDQDSPRNAEVDKVFKWNLYELWALWSY